MAEAMGVTKQQVAKIWASAGLQPHRLRTSRNKRAPQFAEHIVDVVGLYINPPNSALALSVGEIHHHPALNRTQPTRPPAPAQVGRRPHNYQRNGPTNLFVAFDIAARDATAKVAVRHRTRDLLDFLDMLTARTQSAAAVHIILDSNSTHKTNEMRAWLTAHRSFHLHIAPNTASWLNAVEFWFSSLERRAILGGVFSFVTQLKRAISHYIAPNNSNDGKPFLWIRSAEPPSSSRAEQKNLHNYDRTFGAEY